MGSGGEGLGIKRLEFVVMGQKIPVHIFEEGIAREVNIRVVNKYYIIYSM